MNDRIDRIDGNKYYEYTKIKNLNVSNSDEKFSLDYKQDELQSEKEKKKEKPGDGQELEQPKLYNGVRLDISGSARLTDTAHPKRQINTAGRQLETSPLAILTSVKEIITTAIAAVKDFFYKIWNDSGAETAVPETSGKTKEELLETTEAVEPAGEPIPEVLYESASDYRRKEALLDREIQPYLRNGDLNQVISLLTDNGKKAAARNSTLLTYYDRNGKMVEPNASDRERILYGDRNTRKL